jgi:hypothetical protein
MLDSVSWTGITAAALVNMVIGTGWYSPAVFGKIWAHETKVESEGPSALHLLAAFAVSLLTATVLAIFLQISGADTFTSGAAVAFLCWLGFVVTTHASQLIWRGTSWVLLSIDAGYPLVSLMAQGALLIWLK